MNNQSKFTRLVIEEFQRAVREKESYTLPWLDLDVPAFDRYRAGQASEIPGPFAQDPLEARMAADVLNKDILLVAGAGGQQSAVYGLLGAHVTVFDLMEEQLASDRAAAAFYGYPVRTIQGDMRDLSALSDASFDRVHQPISTLYTPTRQDVFNEVARVLRPGGLYYSDYCFPLLYMAHVTGWDGSGYNVTSASLIGAVKFLNLPSGAASFMKGRRSVSTITCSLT